MSEAPILQAEYVFEYEYKRSLGPALSAFFTGLRDGVIVGARAADGRVLVPATEYDEHGQPTGEFVNVSDRGVLVSWAWVMEPLPTHPLPEPFAFALIRLDGAETALTHVVAAPDAAALRTGARVRADWALERGKGILDIRAFVLEEAA